MFNIEKSRMLAEKLLALVDAEQYRTAVRKACQLGKRRLYVPCSFTREEFVSLLHNPRILDVEAQGGSEKEPIYGSFEDALNGRNYDGTKHRGFSVLSGEWTNEYVENYTDRERDSLMSREDEIALLESIANGLKR